MGTQTTPLINIIPQYIIENNNVRVAEYKNDEGSGGTGEYCITGNGVDFPIHNPPLNVPYCTEFIGVSCVRCDGRAVVADSLRLQLEADECGDDSKISCDTIHKIAPEMSIVCTKRK